MLFRLAYLGVTNTLALLRLLPRGMLNHLRLLVRPETVLRWHRDLIACRHARISRPGQVGPPRTARSIRRLVLRLASENPTWDTAESTANYSSWQ